MRRANNAVKNIEPVCSSGNDQNPIYWKTSLRRWAGSDSYPYADWNEHLVALEALDMTERLDRSVLTTTLKLLSERQHVRIGCRISAQSLRFSGWWRLFFRRLGSNPDAAARLIIEVTESRMVNGFDEAITLLRTLRILGCKIAVVDVGLNGSTFDFLHHLRPDFMALNIKELQTRAGHVPPSGQTAYQNLMRLCIELSACVITEAIDTEPERIEAIVSGSRGVHGPFFGSPEIIPSWHNQPVVVWDAFEELICCR